MEKRLVVMVARRGGKVLLVQQRKKHAGRWGLPGGRIRRGEKPARAIRRELVEEVRCSAKALRPIGSCSVRHGLDSLGFSIYVGRVSGSPAPSDEIRAVRWVALRNAGRYRLRPGMGAVLDAVRRVL